MSDLTPCNHCSLLRIKARAEREGKAVTVLADAAYGVGGLNVYVHPKEVNIRKLAGERTTRRNEREKYFTCWFMSLTDHCVC